MPDKIPTSEVLNRAADLIEERGWTQGTQGWKVDGAFLDTDEPWKWNDTRGRTASEVIEVLRATAVIEAARETEAAHAEVSA